MLLKFSDIGNSLGTRVVAQKIRLDIENSLGNNDFVTFDFSNVNSISHSFADECFGKLLLSWGISELKSKTTFTNANDLIKQTIAFTLKERSEKMSVA